MTVWIKFGPGQLCPGWDKNHVIMGVRTVEGDCKSPKMTSIFLGTQRVKARPKKILRL